MWVLASQTGKSTGAAGQDWGKGSQKNDGMELFSLIAADFAGFSMCVCFFPVVCHQKIYIGVAGMSTLNSANKCLGAAVLGRRS